MQTTLDVSVIVIPCTLEPKMEDSQPKKWEIDR